MINLLLNRNNYHAYRFQILAFAFLILTSCSSKPEDSVKEYLDYTFLDNNGKKAYRLISMDDQKYKSEDEFVSEIRRKNMFNEKILKKHRGQFSYEIMETKYLNEDTALVKVSLTKPNTHVILHEMVTFAMTTSFSRMSEEEKNQVMQEQFGKIIKNDEIGVETEEKEFIVVREEGDFKIYLNLGEPHKQELITQQINELESKAEEQKRVIDFQGALNTYRSMYSIQRDETTLTRIEEIEKIQKQTGRLGDKIKVGKLTLTPKKIEVRKINYDKKNWLEDAPKKLTSQDAYLVLTFDVTNNCEGEVFEFYDESRYKKEHTVFDNYGNIMNEFSLAFDMESVEDYKHKKLPAGETMEVKAVCEAPLSRKAQTFLWRMKLYTDNKKTEDHAYVSFSRKDIQFSDKQN